MADVKTVDDVRDALAENDYLADEGLATAIFLALRLERPLLLEGEAGVGKTEVAKVLARWTGGQLVRLQCYEGIDVAQAVYEWDYSRQLLHLRAAEAGGGPVDEDELYSERFLVRRPLLRAIASDDPTPPVLLVDEVDRADDEFEAFLLEILADYSVSVPELGTFRAPEVADRLARQVAAATEAFRDLGLYKPPGVAETLDWARALTYLGTADLDLASAATTLGALLKYREDADRVRAALDRMLSR